MKKVISFLPLLAILILPAMALAATGGGPPEDVDIMEVIENITNWVFVVIMAIAVLVILLAAFRFLFAGGNPESVKGAQQMLLWAAVGILVALVARGIIALIRNVVGA